MAGFSGWAALKDDFETRVSGGANAKTPAFVGHGTVDETVTPDCGADVKTRLTAAGVPVTFNTYPMAHGAHPQEMEELKQWVTECLKLD